MSQIESTFGVPDPEAQKTSGLAIASLVCSFILCCPITTIVGPLLGIAALVKIGGNPALKGRGIALAGILMGVVFTAAQALGVYATYVNIVVPMVVGPRDALATGFGGDVTGFKSHFYGSGATASDAEAAAFIEQLRERYGEFVTSDLEQRDQPQGGPIMEFDYRLTFDSETVNAEAQVVYADEQTGAWPKKLGYIIVFDPDLGDLTYPPSEGESDEAEGNGNNDPETGDGG